MSEQFLATAFVRIQPQIRGFKGQLQKQVNDAIRTSTFSVKVKVTPDFRGFKTALNAGLRNIQGGLTPLKVPVTPVAGKTAAATSGGTSKARDDTAKLSQVQATAKKSTDFLSESFRLNALASAQMSAAFTRSSIQLTGLASAEVQLTGATTALKTVEEGLIAAIRSGNQARVAELTSTRQSLLTIQAEAKTIIQSAAAHELLSDIRTKSAAATEIANIALTRTLTLQAKDAAFTQASQAVKAQLAVIESALATARKAQNEVLEAGLIAQQAELSLIAEKLAVEGALFGVMAKETIATEALKTARAELAIVLQTEIAALTTLDEVKIADAALTRAATKEQTAFAAAEEVGVAAINAETLALERNVAVQRAALASQKDLIKGQIAQNTQQKTATRGALATILSLFGVRGATLAAGNAFLVGAAAVAVFAKAVSSAASLEQELNVFQATADATATEMERVRSTAVELGADISLPAVSAADAAQSFTALAKAGLDVRDAIDGARGVLQLATAAQIDNAQATELVASALNSFSLEGIEATRVADLLTGAANEAQGSITDMGIALQQSSAVARQAGLSLEDTVAFITLLAKNGIRGSDAGTSLRTALLRLIAPTEQASKLLKQFNIRVLDVEGSIRPQAFAELANELDKLGATERNQVLRKIFGQDAIRAAVIFGREGTAGLNAVREATQRVGLASELAEARTKGFSGQVEALKNNTATLGLVLGKLSIGPLGKLVDTLNEAAGAANALSNAIQDLGSADQKSGGGGFLSGLKETLFSSGGDQIREIRSVVGLLKSGNRENIFTDFGRLETATDRVKRINQQIRESVDSAKDLSLGLRDVEGPEEALNVLGSLSGRLIGNSEDAEIARAKIAELATLILALGRTPTLVEISLLFDDSAVKTGLDGVKSLIKRTRLEAELSIAKASLELIKLQAKVTGQDAASLFIAQWASVLTPDAFKKIMEEAFPGLLAAIPRSFAAELPKGSLEGGGLIGKEILGRIAGFDRAKVRAQLKGSTTDLVTVLQQEQAFLQSQLQRNIVQKQPGLKAAVESALLSVQQDIESIAQDRIDKSKDAADAIAKAQEDADKNVLKSFSNREEDAENKILKAEATDSLKDDIKSNIELRAILRKQIRAADDKIKNLETRRDFVRTTRRKILALTNEIRADQRKQRQEERQGVRDTADRAIRGVELDIELAEINENTGVEVKLRRKLIAQLQERIKLEKGNTNKIKELRNEIARQKVAIKEALEESEDRKDAFKALLFSFLQTQQGFAANLLSNLIPTNVTGLSGNAAAAGSGGSLAGRAGAAPLFQPPREISEASTAAAARLGVSSGQANTTNDILNRILRQLEILTGTNRHPEARHQRAASNASLDIH